MIAAEPSMRSVRALHPTVAMPRSIGCRLAWLGAKPVATTASPSSSEPTWMGSPLRVAPAPRRAAKTSSRKGSTMTPAHSCHPLASRLATPMLMPTRGRDCTKLVVPSMGSTIHRYSPALSRVVPSAAALATAPAATDSSPRKLCDGNASATYRSIRSCTSASAAVRRSPRDALVFRTSAPTRATTTSAASRPAATATRTISSSSLAASSHPRTVASALAVSVVDIRTDVCEAQRSPV
mmetsp:Transcript_13613/g.32305  ORF Transcript_13613/g.32305 Transcript_13613/m.32305 type:complete len:238 (+) Transcript_13613:319-1032(+)